MEGGIVGIDIPCKVQAGMISIFTRPTYDY